MTPYIGFAEGQNVVFTTNNARRWSDLYNGGTCPENLTSEEMVQCGLCVTLQWGSIVGLSNRRLPYFELVAASTLVDEVD